MTIIKSSVLNKLLLGLFLVTSWASLAQDGLFESYSKEQGLISPFIYDIYEDEQNRLWISQEGGIGLLNGFTFKKYELLQSYTHLIEFNGEMYALNSTGNLAQFKNQKWVLIENSAYQKLSKFILKEVKVSGDKLYLTTIQGNQLFVTKDLKQFKEVETKKGARYNVYSTDSMTISWCDQQVQNDSIFVQTKMSSFHYVISGGITSAQIHACRLKNGPILIAQGQEVIMVDHGKLLSRSFLDNVVEKIVEDQEEKIWMGMLEGGLINFAGSNLHESNKVNYLSDVIVSDVVEDHEGNIWVGTMGKGIEMMAVPLILEYEKPRVFTDVKDTVKKTIPSRIDVEQAKDEIAQFVYTPVPNYSGIGGVFCTGVKIQSKDTVLLKSYDLNYDENFIKINFGAITKSNIAVNYRYRLEGLEDKWNYSSSSFAYYTSLPHGNYRFVVQASGPDGVWSENEDEIFIQIQQPFWLNVWFYVVSSLLGLLIILLIVWNRLRVLKKKQKEENEKNKLIAHLELNALRAQMNPHFVFNAMNTIQHFIAINDSEKALKLLNDFSKILRSTLENSRKSKIKIEDEIKLLNLYLKIESVRFDGQFEYHIKVDDRIDVSFDEIPPMIIQPYVENALKHGLLPLNGERKGAVTIDLQKKEEDLIIIITDNGVGREKAAENNIGKADKPASQGMKITEERLAVIGSLYGRNVSVEVVDLKNDQGMPTGTKVIILMPLSDE